MKEVILVSSCLCGNNCKYNGGNNFNEDIVSLKEKYQCILVCPEVMGGLGIPRSPSEIQEDGTVWNKDGENVSDNYLFGAKKALAIAKKYGATKALLKEGSPSCGVMNISDGTFAGKKISGSGITTKLLRENGITVYSSENIRTLLEERA